MKRFFRRFIDDRFALTTLQNPLCEVRTYAELVQAAQQERENHPQAAPIPTMPPPAAPDPLPAESLTVQAAAPVAALPLVPVVPTVPVVEVLPEVEVELTQPATPKPRRKSKSRPKSKPRPQPNPRPSPSSASLDALKPALTGTSPFPEPDQPLVEVQELEHDDSPALTSLERHARKCSVCRHPKREYIDEAFLQWRSPQTIMHCFDIKSQTTLYHHAHVHKLFAQRNRNLQFALANIIEGADTRHFTTGEILDAVRALAHINEDGRWIHPTAKSEVVVSTQRLPTGQAVVPTSQAALPPYTQPEPILIASPPGLETDANH